MSKTILHKHFLLKKSVLHNTGNNVVNFTKYVYVNELVKTNDNI